jgi:hypothetical protein
MHFEASMISHFVQTNFDPNNSLPRSPEQQNGKLGGDDHELGVPIGGTGFCAVASAMGRRSGMP